MDFPHAYNCLFMMFLMVYQSCFRYTIPLNSYEERRNSVTLALLSPTIPIISPFAVYGHLPDFNETFGVDRGWIWFVRYRFLMAYTKTCNGLFFSVPIFFHTYSQSFVKTLQGYLNKQSQFLCFRFDIHSIRCVNP